MAKNFIGPSGKYLGGFDGALPPTGSIEVPFAPDDARQKWNGSSWDSVVFTDEEKAAAELKWVEEQKEVVRNEIEVLEDSHSSKRGTVPQWRQYRNELRDYLIQPDFPDGTRPIAPA